jgi:nucleoid DNA-binding protein
VKEINFHIAYLLTKHECVVIPGFGALITSYIPASKKELGEMFSPPARLLSFNPEIKQNDGLLVHFISAVKKIPYREADSLVGQYVNQFNGRLCAGKNVSLPWTGSFLLSSGDKIIFTPAAALSCNAANFGLNHFALLPLKDLKPGMAHELITISLHRRTLAWTASVAAAVLALFMIPTSLNNHSGRQMQNASFFSVFHDAGATKAPGLIPETPFLPDTLSTVPGPAVDLPGPLPVEASSTFRYYIIIASLPTEKAAQTALSDLKREGFSQVAVVNQQGRHRIYIDRFKEKKDAETYLNTFRRDNPKHADAWLFSLR